MKAWRTRFGVLAAGLLVGAGLGLFVLLGLGLVNSWLPASGSNAASGQPQVGPAVNQAAPAFRLQTLDGQTQNLADLQGQVVLVNFWATWCAPCRQEMPLFEAYQQQYAQQLKVLAVNYDEPPAEVQDFVDELGLTLEVLLDPGAQVTDLYRVRAFPTTFLIDEQGVVRVQHIGAMSEGQLVGYLKNLGVAQ